MHLVLVVAVLACGACQSAGQQALASAPMVVLAPPRELSLARFRLAGEDDAAREFWKQRVDAQQRYYASLPPDFRSYARLHDSELGNHPGKLEHKPMRVPKSVHLVASTWSDAPAAASIAWANANDVALALPCDGERPAPDPAIEQLLCFAAKDAGLRELATLPRLRTLDLGDTDITDEGFAHLAPLTSLTRLDVSMADERITDASIAIIGTFTKLVRLEVWRTSITDHGLAHLANLTALVELDLLGTSVTDAGIMALAKLPKLRWLGVYGTNTTPEGCAAFNRALGRAACTH